MQQNAETGRYISYVSREVAAIAVAEEIDDQISKDEVLRIDYDYDKLQKISLMKKWSVEERTTINLFIPNSEAIWIIS